MLVAIVLFGLFAACVALWRRVEALEARLSAFEDRADGSAAAALPVVAPVYREPESPAYRPELPGESEVIPETLAQSVRATEPEPAETAQFSAEPPVEAMAQPADTTTRRHHPEPRPAPNFSFEDIFGRYLPIWAGGVTLAIAGFLIVKYSIDAGLLSPLVRVICGLIFGGGLIAAAEIALRKEDWVRDARVRQALSGAGIATLYAAILVAANLYHLVGPMTAFAGLAAVTVLAGLLSIRFGAPSAMLGLIGGLAAPALVGAGAPNVPLLATYLALTVGGLSMLGRSQRWWWLGALAVTGGFGWGLLLLLGGLHSVAATLSIGTLTLMLAIGFPLLVTGGQARAFQLIAALAGCAQIAAIVATGGFASLEWGLFALISVAILWLSRRDATLAGLPIAGLATGILLSVAWPSPAELSLALVLGGGAVIYGVPALWRLWRSEGRLDDAGQLAAIAFATVLVPIAHYWTETPRVSFVPLALLGAVIAGTAAAIGWRNPGRSGDARFAILALAGLVLGLLAVGLALPVWALAPATMVVAVTALLLGRISSDPRLENGSYGFVFAGLAFLLAASGADEVARAMVATDSPATIQGLVRWLVPALAALAFARWSNDFGVRQVGQAGAVLLGYVAAAQIVPHGWQALIPAGMLAALALAGKRMPIASVISAAMLSAAWALQPLLIWLVGAGGALIGEPFLVTALPATIDVAVRILAPMAAMALLLWRGGLPRQLREIGALAAVVLGLIAVHVAWKHVFAINGAEGFASYGMAERTLWEMLLTGLALLAWRLGWRRVAEGLGAVALLHFAWFSVLLHNPLWAIQNVGPWLVPAYATAFFAIWWSARIVDAAQAAQVRDWARMVLILMLAASLLRQAFHGTILAAGPTFQSEDIGRSLLAILLAIGFLLWGIRRSLRDWRIVSLVLMLGAVGKVFLLDAAGLDGLLRIASFAALGLSLIGMGWLYSRYLPDAGALTDESHSTDTVADDIRG